MDLISSLSLGELALSFSRVPLFPVFDLSYFIVSIIYLKYEPGESGVVGVTKREVAHGLRTEARGVGKLDPRIGEEAVVEIAECSHAHAGGGGDLGDRGAVERGLQMRWKGRRGAHLFTVRRTGAAGLGCGRGGEKTRVRLE